MGCALGYEIVSGRRTFTCVSENESVACLTGSLPACQVTRHSTCTNIGQIGVSEDGGKNTYGAPCQAACAVGFESANHTEASGLAIGQSERSVLMWLLVTRLRWHKIARTGPFVKRAK